MKNYNRKFLKKIMKNKKKHQTSQKIKQVYNFQIKI